MFKALLRLYDAKAALALEAELEVKRSLFVSMDSQMANEMDIIRKKYESFNQRKKLSNSLSLLNWKLNSRKLSRKVVSQVNEGCGHGG